MVLNIVYCPQEFGMVGLFLITNVLAMAYHHQQDENVECWILDMLDRMIL